jgi:hypothetical protein
MKRKKNNKEKSLRHKKNSFKNKKLRKDEKKISQG